MSPSEREEARRFRLIARLTTLPAASLGDVEAFLDGLGRPTATLPQPVSQPPNLRRSWAHAPPHRLSDEGTYIVTAATLDKFHAFRGADRLSLLHDEIHGLLEEAGWEPEAWAVFSNHYHVIVHAGGVRTPLVKVLKELHRRTTLAVNDLDDARGRDVWFNYWDTALTFEKSYLARLAYVHSNPVRHGLVREARDYPWCSAAWHERTATPAQVATLATFRTDRVNVQDDFEPVM